MMLARVADSLYWIGRYIERAEHVSRLSAVMLNATLDRTQGAVQTGRIGLAALGEPDSEADGSSGSQKQSQKQSQHQKQNSQKPREQRPQQQGQQQQQQKKQQNKAVR